MPKDVNCMLWIPYDPPRVSSVRRVEEMLVDELRALKQQTATEHETALELSRGSFALRGPIP